MTSEQQSTLHTVREFLSFRATSLALGLAILALAIGGIALKQSLEDNSFTPVSGLRVEFEQGTAQTGGLARVRLTGNVEDEGGAMTLFLFSQWVSDKSQVTTGPTIAGGVLRPGSYSRDIDLFVPMALPPGRWRLVLSGIVLSGARSQAVAAASTTKPAGDADYLIVEGD